MKEYETTVKDLLALEPMQWIEYEAFRKNVIVPRESRNAASSVPAAGGSD